ncbi:MAG: ACT domain-containing protein [Candidatus Methylophosphatis roskildensis]
MTAQSTRIIVSVIGQDKVGIIAGVSAILAQSGANILDISQTVMDDCFTMIMMVDLEKAGVSFEELKRLLDQKGNELGVRIDAQQEDVFRYMHRL